MKKIISKKNIKMIQEIIIKIIKIKIKLKLEKIKIIMKGKVKL
jgi:hypothetical protein